MNLALGAFDIVSLTAFAVALYFLFRTPSGSTSPFSTGAKAFLVAAAVVYILVMLNDALDRMGWMSPIEPFEDSIELMFMPLVLVSVYSLLVRQKFNDARRINEGLLHTGDMMIRAIESTPAGTVWIDTEGHIAFANPAAREMLDLEGTATDEETGHPDWIVRTGSSVAGRSSISPDFSKLVTREPLFDVQVIVEWPSGWRRRFSVNTAPTLSPGGRIEGVIASFLDKEPWRVLQAHGASGSRRGHAAPEVVPPHVDDEGGT
ncbi:MAG: PAS domain-containing protein [Coriobacteriia bacterium]|nr:PAS domain-containing protein [Coriobacteriia bacterium]